MAWRKLEKSEAEAYCDTLSRALKDNQAEIEIMAVGVMDRKETAWIRIHGLTYNPDEDILYIYCDNLDHQIKKPREINLYETDSGLEMIEIVAADGYKHLLHFRKPVKA